MEENLFDLWAKRDPHWERHFANSIINVFSDYGKGNTSTTLSRGKIFGAGYEMFIIAFFIGLYFDKTRALTEDKNERWRFGQAIMYWGNIESRGTRKAYGRLREYIFVALIAKTDIDLIALDKGDSNVTAKHVVDILVKKMEEYANYGFYYMEECLSDDPNYFFKDGAFFNEIYKFTINTKSLETDENKLEPLD